MESVDIPEFSMTLEGRQAVRRVLWWAWGITIALSAFAPLLRPITSVKGSGKWAIFGVVAVMVIAMWLIRKSGSALFSAIAMSASGLTVGASLGFVMLGVWSGKATVFLIAAKWILGAGFLTWLFLKQLKREEQWALQEEQWKRESDLEVERVRQMSPDEQRAFFEEYRSRTHAELSHLEERSKRLNRRVFLLSTFSVLAVVALEIVRAYAK